MRQLQRTIRQHFRKGYDAAWEPGEESLVHSTVESAVDRDDWHVVLDQLCVFDFVGVLFLQGRPGDLRIDDEGRTFTHRIERQRVRRLRQTLRIEHVTATAASAALALRSVSILRRLDPVFEEEAQHLPRGVRSPRIGVGAGRAAS